MFQWKKVIRALGVWIKKWLREGEEHAQLSFEEWLGLKYSRRI